MRTDINVWTDDQPLKALHDEGDGFLWITTADASVPRAISIFGNPTYLSRLAAAINAVGQDEAAIQPAPSKFTPNSTIDDEIPF